MRFTWPEELDMVRSAVSRFAKDLLSVSHNDTKPFDAEVLRELGLLDMVWEDDPKMAALVLFELAKADAVASLAVLRALNHAATGSDGLGFVSKDRVVSFFAPATLAYSADGAHGASGFEPVSLYGLKSAAAYMGNQGAKSDATVSWIHTALALIVAGLATDALKVGYGYANERVQFGKRIADFQGTQFKLAEMSSRTDAATLLAFRSLDAPEFAQASRALALDAALYVTDEALQMHGGYGYTREYRIERLYRDVRALAPLLGA